MTLENCKKLLEHYEAVGNKEAADEMRAKLELRGEPVKASKSSKKDKQ